MRFGLLLLLALVRFPASSAFAQAPAKQLEASRLSARHEQRLDWMMHRVIAPPPGIYQDFRAILDASDDDSEQMLKAAQAADARVVLFDPSKPLLWRGMQSGILFLPNDKQSAEIGQLPMFATEPTERQEGVEYLDAVLKNGRERGRLQGKLKDFPAEVAGALPPLLPYKSAAFNPYLAAFRHSSTHILASELTEETVRASISQGRAYVAHDWLCDPTGFSLIAQNAMGIYEIGDTVPAVGDVRLEAVLPVSARVQLRRNGQVVAEVHDMKISYIAKEEGEYRLEAWLKIDSEEKPWILTGPLYVKNLPAPSMSAEISPNVEVHRGISYTEGLPEDSDRHQLDLFVPKGASKFSTVLFLYGGAWRSGDRALYSGVGNRFAKAGVAVAIPNYRLMPKDPHPAQVEDAAAAFAWVYKNISQFGGDASRIYVVGHSTGGHLAALLALDRRYLAKHELATDAIKGVASISGMYEVSKVPDFAPAEGKPDGSPMRYVHSGAPPFLVAYCQWDYLGLPNQARIFWAALRRTFVEAKLVYVPGQSHVSEVMDLSKDDDFTARAILDFVR